MNQELYQQLIQSGIPPQQAATMAGGGQFGGQGIGGIPNSPIGRSQPPPAMQSKIFQDRIQPTPGWPSGMSQRPPSPPPQSMGPGGGPDLPMPQRPPPAMLGQRPAPQQQAQQQKLQHRIVPQAQNIGSGPPTPQGIPPVHGDPSPYLIPEGPPNQRFAGGLRDRPPTPGGQQPADAWNDSQEYNKPGGQFSSQPQGNEMLRRMGTMGRRGDMPGGPGDFIQSGGGLKNTPQSYPEMDKMMQMRLMKPPAKGTTGMFGHDSFVKNMGQDLTNFFDDLTSGFGSLFS